MGGVGGDYKKLLDRAQGYYFGKPMPAEEELEMYRLPNWGHLCRQNKLLRGKPLTVMRVSQEERFIHLLALLEGVKSRYIAIQTEENKYLLDTWRLRYEMDQKTYNLLYYRKLSQVLDNYRNLFIRWEELVRLNEPISPVGILEKVENSSHEVFLVGSDGEEGYLERHELIELLYRKLYKELLSTNPLTHLPGNELIQKKIKELISAGGDFYVCYLDIDNFKAFNDSYGFYAGDQMIKKVGLILSVFKNRLEECFLGHVGGDDFVLLFWNMDKENIVELLKGLAKEIKSSLLEFYSEEDRKRGYFVGEDREGKVREFPLASISIALVKGSDDITDISKRSARLKKEAKSKPGTTIAVESLNQILTISL